MFVVLLMFSEKKAKLANLWKATISGSSMGSMMVCFY
jgi:hypothetical protein